METIEALLHAAQTQPWAIHRVHFESMLKVASSFDFDFAGNADDLLATDSADADGLYEVHNGVALIGINGSIMRNVPRLFRVCGCDATGTEDTIRALRLAAEDSSVKSILLGVSSPGGTIGGVAELGDEIYNMRGAKPIHAAVTDLCASAALWIASQADSISANLTAHVGSIGVYSWITDNSAACESRGVKTHLISSGIHKGLGVSGVSIADFQLEPMREENSQLAEMFIAAVARGRGMPFEQVKELATGRTWLSPAAMEIGLIDRIETIEESFIRISQN